MHSNCLNQLINIVLLIPTLQLDIRYATSNNFTHHQIYPTIAAQHAFLQEPAARALAAVQADLELLGLGLKVFDAYRPHAVQYIFWKMLPDERYVANPEQGSRHNRGCAVDLTLIRLNDKTELVMPTEFDDFSAKAHSFYQGASPEALANRTLLQEIMTKHGFEIFETEWWHFDYKDWREYPILDIPFEELV